MIAMYDIFCFIVHLGVAKLKLLYLRILRIINFLYISGRLLRARRRLIRGCWTRMCGGFIRRFVSFRINLLSMLVVHTTILFSIKLL